MAFRLLIAAAVILALSSGTRAEAPSATLRHQRGDTLEITPQVNPQRPKIDVPLSPRRPPVPAERVLILPQASRDFIGLWGGRLKLSDFTGKVNPPPETVVSLSFGERRGSVFLRTTVFGAAGSNILRTEAEALTPDEVKLKLDGFDINHDPPVRHLERLVLSLDGRGGMECVKRVEISIRGFPQPIARISYRGRLRLITEQEERVLESEVIRRGGVPQATIRESRPIGR